MCAPLGGLVAQGGLHKFKNRFSPEQFFFSQRVEKVFTTGEKQRSPVSLSAQKKCLPVFFLLQYRIGKHEREHRLCHRENPGHDAGVVPAAHGDVHHVPVDVPGLLDFCDGGRRFYRDAHHDLLPDEMPPRMPPAWLLKNPVAVIESLFSLPNLSATRNPSPISTPLTAPIPIIAPAIAPSSFPNTGRQALPGSRLP